MKKVFLMVMVVVLILAMGVVSFAYSYQDTNVSAFDSVGNVVIGAIQAIAMIVAIAVLLYVGIKFMLASPSEKANLKGMLIPYIVGAVLIFAAIPLIGMLKSATSGISNP